MSADLSTLVQQTQAFTRPTAPAVILIVDDIEDNRIVLRRRLEKLGYETVLLESQGVPGGIQVSAETYARLRDGFVFDPRGPIPIKGRAPLATYLLRGRAGPYSAAPLRAAVYR